MHLPYRQGRIISGSFSLNSRNFDYSGQTNAIHSGQTTFLKSLIDIKRS